MVGVDPATTLVGNQWMDLVHIEDRDRIVAVLEAHLCGDTDHFETEVRMKDSQQGFRWICLLYTSDAADE